MPTRLAWIAFPLAAFFAVLVRLWHDAPVLDDYYTVLLSVVSMLEAESAREWLGVVLAQHNEHRVATGNGRVIKPDRRLGGPPDQEGAPRGKGLR